MRPVIGNLNISGISGAGHKVSLTPAGAKRSPAIHIEDGSPSPKINKAVDEVSDDDETIILDTDCLTQKNIKHSNGVRPNMLDK